MRSASIDRHTKETQIRGRLAIEGRGRYEISTGVRFFDHMLELFTKHGGFDLKLKAAGDLDVDQHHTVEDVGIVLGQLFDRALGDRKGINRAGYFVLPALGPRYALAASHTVSPSGTGLLYPRGLVKWCEEMCIRSRK